MCTLIYIIPEPSIYSAVNYLSYFAFYLLIQILGTILLSGQYIQIFSTKTQCEILFGYINLQDFPDISSIPEWNTTENILLQHTIELFPN